MNRTVEQTFVRSWTKLQSWAANYKTSQFPDGIPKAAIIPVYRMDAQRVLNGETAMGAGERYRAVLAAASEKAITSIPTDHPSASLSPGNVWGNVENNLQQIFVGLNPIGLVKGAVDTVKNTIEHPLTAFPHTIAGFEKLATHPTLSLLSWLPGVTDLAQYEKTGLDRLLTHPVSALLDIMPVDRIPDVALYGQLGDRIATKLGVPVEQLRAVHGSPGVKALARVAMQKQLKNTLVTIGKDDAGNLVRTPHTIESWLATFGQRHHFGKEASTLTYNALELSQEGQREAKRLLAPLNDAMQQLPTPTRMMVITTLTMSGEDYADIASDDSIPIQVRKVISLYQPVEQWLQERALATGKIVKVRMPTGQEMVYTTQIGRQIQSRMDNIDKLSQGINEQMDVVDQFDKQGQQLDQQINPIMMQLNKGMEDIIQYLMQTIPHDNKDVSSTVRDTIPAATKWEKGTTSRSFKTTRIRSRYTGDNPRYHNQQVKAALKSPLAKSLFGKAVTSTKDIFKTQANVLEDVFGPEGIIERMKKARSARDHVEFYRLAKELSRKLNGVYAKQLYIESAPNFFDNLRNLVSEDSLGNLAKDRSMADDKMWKAIQGVDGRAYKGSMLAKVKIYQEAVKALTRYIWEKPGLSNELHIPAIYQPIYQKYFAQALHDSEKAPEIKQLGIEQLKKKGFTDEQIQSLLQDNAQHLFEMISQFANSTFDDPIVGANYVALKEEAARTAINQVKELYARGEIVHYVPQITPYEMKDEMLGTYNVFIHSDRIPTPNQVFSRTWNFGSSVHNFMAAVTSATKSQLQHDLTVNFVHEAMRLGYNKNDVEDMMLHDPEYQARFANVNTDEERGAVRARIFKELGLQEWNPDQIFNIRMPRSSGMSDTILMPTELLKTIEMITDKAQFPMTGIYDKVTGLFKFSILGLSPRYTAHILFGGSYLVAMRIDNPINLVRMIPAAYKAAKHGTLPGEISDKVFSDVTQRGNADVAFHYMGGRTAARWMIEEKLAARGINPKVAVMADWMSAVANINYTFTGFVSNMQRAMIFFDAVGKDGLHDLVDEDGNKIEGVSSDRALKEGLQAVSRVMGDVRRMSPFERAWMTRVFPFYGWTKHILKYVMTYPFDHPLRASILSDLAMSNSENVKSGWPLRIQLMFFLGSPTPQGTVTGFTVRALDPLRTTANYASMSGWISGLNPMITAAFASVDPNITFGNNTLYPTISYNSVYGVEQANASGNFFNTLVQEVVPESAALAAGLSLGSYQSLRKNDPTAFKKAIYEALNVPFLEEQHLNLRQIAAKAEMDRYQTARAAAKKAVQTGTFNTLKRYGTVPYPLNDVYNVTPAQLEAIYNTSIQQYGLSPLETLTVPKSPPGL